MNTNLQENELKLFFNAANLIERQLANDSLEIERGYLFKVPKIEVDGDFNQSENTIDEKRLESVLKWIREQFDWSENDLKIESRSGGKYIGAKDPKKLIAFLKNHLENSNSISVTKDLTKLAFYTKDTADASNLSHKGIAVVQHYFAKKDKMRNDTFIGDTTDLMQAFNEFAKSNDGTKFSILYRTGAHWIPVQCEKRNGQFFIMEMDSLGSKDQGKIVIHEAVIKSNLPKNKVTVLRAQNQRQMAGNNCAYFAMKDARRMQNNPNLIDELLKHEVAREKRADGLTFVKYLTPKEHMGAVQSKTKIKEYVTTYNKLHSEGKLASPTTENDILKISFEKMRKSDKSRVADTGNSQQNKTILYFKDKFISSVVNEKVNSSSLKELSEIVETYSIHSITTQRLNKTAMEPRQNVSVSNDRAEPIVIAAPITPAKAENKVGPKKVTPQPTVNIPKTPAGKAVIKPVVRPVQSSTVNKPPPHGSVPIQQPIKENIPPQKPVSEIPQEALGKVEQTNKAKPNKAFKNKDFLAGIQQRKEQAKEKFKEPSEAVAAPISKEPLSKMEEVLHENFQELLREKIIELPTYIKPEIFEEYLKGNINLDKLLENKPKTRAHQRAQEGKAGNRPTAAMMAELQQKLGIKSAQSQEMPQKPSVQDQPKGEFKQETPEKAEITPDSILKKLMAAADAGMAGVNKPLAGNNGVVNYLFNKTAIVEERQLRKEFLQMVSADKQAGRAVQNKEAFLAHAKKFGTVQKNLEDNEPKAPTPKKPAALTISHKQKREEKLSQPPIPAVASKLVEQNPSQDKENVNPRLQQANLQSKHHSHTDIYMQTWNKYNEKLSALMPDKKYGFITNNSINNIHKFLKQHEKCSATTTEQYKRLTDLRNELLKSHSNNPTLKQMIGEFCAEYKKLPPPPKHTINISRKM